jgi:hypothetical protein
MEIRTKRWLVAPLSQSGRRCWQVFRLMASGRAPSNAACYHVNLADALAWCAEYELRNDLDQAAELAAVADSVRTEHDRFMNEVNKSLNEHGIS